MLRELSIRCLAFSALLSIVGSCGVLDPDEKNQLTLYVAPTRADCEGAGPQQCYLVKEHAAEEWSYYYGSISGFVYEPGYTFKLLVERRHAPDPPLDGSSREYRLLRILARDLASPTLSSTGSSPVAGAAWLLCPASSA